LSSHIVPGVSVPEIERAPSNVVATWSTASALKFRSCSRAFSIERLSIVTSLPAGL